MSRSEAARVAANTRWAGHSSTFDPTPLQSKDFDVLPKGIVQIGDFTGTITVPDLANNFGALRQEAEQIGNQISKLVKAEVEAGRMSQEEALGRMEMPDRVIYESVYGDRPTVEFNQPLIARDATGLMGGAIMVRTHRKAYDTTTNQMVPGNYMVEGKPALHVALIGSFGIVPGVGTALVHSAERVALSKGLGMSGYPRKSAEKFWQKQGWHPIADSDGGQNLWGITHEELRAKNGL